MYICSSCGKILSDGVSICPECGAKNARHEEVKKCVACKESIPQSVNYCPHCGGYKAVHDFMSLRCVLKQTHNQWDQASGAAGNFLKSWKNDQNGELLFGSGALRFSPLIGPAIAMPFGDIRWIALNEELPTRAEILIKHRMPSRYILFSTADAAKARLLVETCRLIVKQA